MNAPPTIQAPVGEQVPVRRGTPLWYAAIMARAATQANIAWGDFNWTGGMTCHIDPGQVTIKQNEAVLVTMPIYEAARLKLETDR